MTIVNELDEAKRNPFNKLTRNTKTHCLTNKNKQDKQQKSKNKNLRPSVSTHVHTQNYLSKHTTLKNMKKYGL